MAKKQNCSSCKDPARLNKVGGQAVLEGVMMKAGERTVTSCRKEDGSIVVNDGSFVSVRKKHGILNIPILRGVINFVEMMILSFKTLNISAEALEIDDEKDKARKAEGKKTTTDFVMIIGGVLGVLLAVGLFILLPGYASDLVVWLFKKLGDITVGVTVKAIIEGVIKVIIFVSYLALVSLMPDIKRTFMYHGAEHKSIACFESGDELTPENAKKYTRFHPRCGTSFMFVMILLGIIVGIVINNIFPTLDRWLISIIRLLILPLVVGIGYEFIMFAGKHPNPFTAALSAPGLWMQRITTKEPTEDMLEIAITSIKCALRDEFPEFKEFYENSGWLTEEQKADSSADDTKGNEEISEESTSDAELTAGGEEKEYEPEDVSEADKADASFETAAEGTEDKA